VETEIVSVHVGHNGMQASMQLPQVISLPLSVTGEGLDPRCTSQPLLSSQPQSVIFQTDFSNLQAEAEEGEEAAAAARPSPSDPQLVSQLCFQGRD
jgi:hypothetical protein